MNIYILLPIIAFSINIFVWIYVFAQQKRDPVNVTFLMFAACNIGWIGSDLLMYVPALRGHETEISRLCAFFWIPCGFWFLLFAYALLNQKADWKLYLAASAAAAGVGIMAFTDAVLVGFKQFDWGTAPIFHPIYQPLISVITATTSAYAVLLILKKRKQSLEKPERLSLGLLVWGAIVVMGFISVANVFLPSVLNIHTYPMIGSSAFTVFVVLVFFAITRYRFLSISVEKVADELFEDLHEGVLLADRTGRIQRSNSLARSILGELLEGKDVRDLFIGHDTGGDLSDAIVKLIGRDSDERCYALSTSTIRRRGDVLGKIFMMRDITEQKKAEAVLQRSKEDLEREVQERTKQLKHAQRMEAIGTLAGGIAHDFNNVLAVILGFANAAKQDIPKSNPVYEDIGEIIVAGNRGREIVKQILTISRKQDTSEFSTADISCVVRETLDLFRVSLPSNILLNANYPSVEVVVRCDTTQIAQVIMNLCNNAMYSMKDSEKGRLTVDVTQVSLDESTGSPASLRPGPYVRLRVGDTGCGIDEEFLSQIFNPFFTTKPQGEGTGLGLATAYVIIKNHDGDIVVESEVGKGTRFSIYLPILLGEYALDTRRDSDPSAPFIGDRRASILFVDDEQQVRRMGRRVLEQLSLHVTTADSALEALDILQRGTSKYDLIITDYNMPGMNGLELASALFRSPYQIPVILMSGYGDKVTPEDIETAGINAFLPKPTPKNMLAEAIGRILEKNISG